MDEDQCAQGTLESGEMNAGCRMNLYTIVRKRTHAAAVGRRGRDMMAVFSVLPHYCWWRFLCLA